MLFSKATYLKIMQKSDSFKIAFLLSGKGGTLANLLQKMDSNVLKVTLAVVISSQPKALGLVKAHQANIPTVTVPYQQYKHDLEAYSRALTQVLNDFQVDLGVMGGFLSLYKVPMAYQNKIINIHPSLLPAFSGPGFYGLNVHRAVLNQNVSVTGCTVHFVDNAYDQGTIIAQETVLVDPSETPESLQRKVQAKEYVLYPKVIKQLSENKSS